MSATTTKIAGLKELMAGLEALPAALEKKAVYAALAGAGKVVSDDAKKRAPTLSAGSIAVRDGRRKPGTLKRAVRASKSKINKGQRGLFEVIVRVKPLKAKARKAFKKSAGKSGAENPNDPYYWWWVEFGTRKMAARPFMRPAFWSTKSAQLERMRTRMAASIAKEAQKIAQGVRRGT